MNDTRPRPKARSTRCAGMMPMLAAGLALILLALPASGQPSVDEMRPPSVTSTGEPPVIRMYLVTALIGGLVIGANLIPSKRGHQD